MSESDIELLARYRRERSEEAFSEIVRRHLALVHSAALRQVRLPQLAEEIAQTTFLELASQADRLQPSTQLAAWLYEATRRNAVDVLRRESRRDARERTAMELNSLNAGPSEWSQLEPVLDDAMAELPSTDRTAILLRYFENRSLRDVGAALGVSDDAAQKRVSRAVDELRSLLAKRGVTVGAGALVAVISGNAVQATPDMLAASVTSAAATAGLIVAASQTAPFLSLFTPIRFSAAVVIAVAMLGGLRWLVSDSASVERPRQSESAAASETNVPQKFYPFGNRASALPGSGTPTNSRMKFRVVDASTGLGLGSARIRAGYFYTAGRSERHDLVTDEQGNAFIPKPREVRDQGLNVFVGLAGYVPKAISFDLDNTADYVLALESAASAAGIVVDELGVPVAGVKIQGSRRGDYKHGSPNTDFHMAEAETDANGEWVYPYIPRGEEKAYVTLTRESFAVTEVSVPIGFQGTTNGQQVIKRGFVVVGRVVDEQGMPVAEATVRELHDFSHRKLSAVTGFEGDFLFQGLSTNFEPRVQIVVQAQGMAPSVKTIDPRGPTNTVQFVLGKGRLFRGRIVDAKGNPIPKAVVRTDGDFKNQISIQFKLWLETDSDGRFEWDSAPAKPVCYWFEADGYKVQRSVRLVADGSEHLIVLEDE